eukprot:TRINITY_DN1978_c0_g1_i1.p2 TRINITY_DN1978_c0_g1~~TRINITY_DN1978_c0_g1_i1.p2  ORF type:complete len:204 (+),score=30.40 TRINITY_DN1978_c0_g1_i1:338-949(+)
MNARTGVDQRLWSSYKNKYKNVSEENVSDNKPAVCQDNLLAYKILSGVDKVVAQTRPNDGEFDCKRKKSLRRLNTDTPVTTGRYLPPNPTKHNFHSHKSYSYKPPINRKKNKQFGWQKQVEIENLKENLDSANYNIEMMQNQLLQSQQQKCKHMSYNQSLALEIENLKLELEKMQMERDLLMEENLFLESQTATSSSLDDMST